MKELILVTLVVIFGSTLLHAQRVSPYQPGSYYPGLINLRDLATPPAGILVLDYNYWMSSNGYYDKNGEPFSGGVIELPPPADPIEVEIDPSISGYINAPVIFYASKFQVLNGARYLASIVPVYLRMDYNAFLAVGDTSGGISGSTSGFGDMSFMPLGLSWALNKKLDISFLYSIYAPTGRYKTGADDNLGQGFWTHQIQLPTYFYIKEQATALALIPTLEMNSKVKDADAKMGERFSLEYGISQYFTSWLEVELMNGHNWQLGADSGDDVWWTGTRFDGLDRKSTFSAGINVWPVEGILQLRVKYITDYNVKQRFKNQFWSFSLLLIPGILTETSHVNSSQS